MTKLVVNIHSLKLTKRDFISLFFFMDFSLLIHWSFSLIRKMEMRTRLVEIRILPMRIYRFTEHELQLRRSCKNPAALVVWSVKKIYADFIMRRSFFIVSRKKHTLNIKDK